jgi:aryl carrier-like protein
MGKNPGIAELDQFESAVSELANFGFPIFVPPQGQLSMAPVYPFLGKRIWLNPIEDKAGLQQKAAQLDPQQLSSITPVNNASPHQLWLERLSSSLASLSGLSSESLDPTSSWVGLGLDSILLTQWALKLQKQWSLSMNLSMLQNQHENLESLARHLHQLRPLGPSNEDSLASQPGLAADALTTADEIPAFLQNQAIDGEIEFANDSGVQRLPHYRGSFLALDSQGQVALFVENPEVAGEYWQLTKL